MENNFKDDTHLQKFEAVSIIADKVYAHCKQKECFEAAKAALPSEGQFEIIDIDFQQGEIIEGTLLITSIHNRPNFSRVRFSTKITFNVRVKNIDTGRMIDIEGSLPNISNDIVLYIPKTRKEFKFKIDIETASQTLSEPQAREGFVIFSVGVLMIVRVVGRVQLLIPGFGFCPEPPDHEEFKEKDAHEEFSLTPFSSFFPEQFKLDDKVL
ncbi:hypothetical protein SAMN05660297_00397 [Natronincola peptidivorans]|uniref:SipL SPOCS domain-containing protein n=1 Tax=Natronincola peptidivorans TaxID=426128 RepID=A0A1H9YTD3_9FIRM|nr:hypothetical protein [Natronincola peptidivorans]SES72391.1 hypothetical protein SAMN05660297_00397 [Natronincola peptidivorans]